MEQFLEFSCGMLRSNDDTTYHIYVAFVCGCAPDVVVASYFVHCATHIWRDLGKSALGYLSLILESLWSLYIISIVVAHRSYHLVCALHYIIIMIIHTSESSEQKCLWDIFFWRVSLRLSPFSKSYFMQQTWLCAFSSPMIVRMCVIHVINIVTSGLLIASHCRGFRVMKQSSGLLVYMFLQAFIYCVVYHRNIPFA